MVRGVHGSGASRERAARMNQYVAIVTGRCALYAIAITDESMNSISSLQTATFNGLPASLRAFRHLYPEAFVAVIQPKSLNSPRSELHEKIRNRLTAIRALLLAFGVLVLAATSWPRRVRQLLKSSPTPMVSSPTARSKRFAIPGTHPSRASIFPALGLGSPRTARSPMRERIRTASRRRSPTCARSSAGNRPT